jgi:hypothetical protein
MLAGKIGFEQWMNRAFAGALSDPTIGAKTSSIASIGHTFEFSLDVNGNASPVFTIVPAPIVTLTPTGTIDRLEDNIVDVSLGKAASATDTVSKTTAKYNADQLKAIEDLTAAINKLTEQLDKDHKTLAANKDFIAQGKELQSFLLPEFTIKERFPQANQELLTEKRADAQRFFRDPTVEPKLQEFLTLEKTVNDNQKALTAAKGQLLDTINHPAEQTTTRREVRATSPLSPDLNPNVTNTQLQLTFERLNNSLRTPIP